MPSTSILRDLIVRIDPSRSYIRNEDALPFGPLFLFSPHEELPGNLRVKAVRGGPNVSSVSGWGRVSPPGGPIPLPYGARLTELLYLHTFFHQTILHFIILESLI